MKRKDLQDLEDNGELGDFFFFDVEDGNGKGMYFRYPTPNHHNLWPDRGEVSWIPVSLAPKVPNRWLWDGNEDAPTISPSIHIIGQWHGYIENGKIRTV